MFPQQCSTVLHSSLGDPDHRAAWSRTGRGGHSLTSPSLGIHYSVTVLQSDMQKVADAADGVRVKKNWAGVNFIKITVHFWLFIQFLQKKWYFYSYYVAFYLHIHKQITLGNPMLGNFTHSDLTPGNLMQFCY